MTHANQQPKKPPGRLEKRAEALRQNLKKRKEQAGSRQKKED